VDQSSTGSLAKPRKLN